MQRVTIRPAAERDASVIAGIYNQGIRGRGATFETVERGVDDVLDWLRDRHVPAHPFLVATDADAEVLGWVRASSYRSRACYAGNAEFSIYVAERARGRRVGDALMAAFIESCTSAGLSKLISRIFPENRASLALCVRHGFREVGIYERHARLDGVWRDVVIVERLLPEVPGSEEGAWATAPK